MVDASYGFEMETFEFLNICQVHGMPRVLGVLNHLDCLKGMSKVSFSSLFISVACLPTDYEVLITVSFRCFFFHRFCVSR